MQTHTTLSTRAVPQGLASTHTRALSVVSSADIQPGRRTHCDSAALARKHLLLWGPTWQPRTHKLTRTHRHSGTRLSQPGKGQGSPPEGAVGAAGGLRLPRVPVPPLHSPMPRLYSALRGESRCNCCQVQPLAAADTPPSPTSVACPALTVLQTRPRRS